MKLLRYLVLITILRFDETLAIRNIFQLDRNQYLADPLLLVNREHLMFVGSILQNGNSIGFIKDAAGNVFVVMEGRQVGADKMIVNKVLKNKVILANDEGFVVIK